jgi:hypothetical protein
VAFERKWRRQVDRLAERRANLDEPGFVALLADSADADVAEWLWDELLVYWRPNLTPHPDDDFLRDLPIDPEEPNDWLDRFCTSQGLEQKGLSGLAPRRGNDRPQLGCMVQQRP